MVLIVLSLGGTALSVTGVVVGWRRLRVKARSGRKRHTHAPAGSCSERPYRQGPARKLAMFDGSECMSRLRGGNDAAPQAHTVLHSIRSPDRKRQTVL